MAAEAWRQKLGGGGSGPSHPRGQRLLPIPPSCHCAPPRWLVETKTPAATAMVGAQTTINNKLKAVVAKATEMAMVTEMTTTMKT